MYTLVASLVEIFLPFFLKFYKAYDVCVCVYMMRKKKARSSRFHRPKKIMSKNHNHRASKGFSAFYPFNQKITVRPKTNKFYKIDEEDTQPQRQHDNKMNRKKHIPMEKNQHIIPLAMRMRAHAHSNIRKCVYTVCI